MAATEKLATFVCDTKYADLPEGTIEKAKICFLDGLGVALAGYQHEATKMVHHLASELGGHPQASIIGSGFKTSPPLAGPVNGMMCHVMDFDDTNWKLKGHPTAVLLPTILAIGEKLKSGGKDILSAYILGYEAACKIAKAMGPVNEVLELLQENHINPDNIVSLRCGTDEECFNILIHPIPNDDLEAKFSLPYCLARACIDGDLRLEYFSDKAIHDHDVNRLMERVEHYVSSEIMEKGYDFRNASKVTLELENGKTLEKVIVAAKGNPNDPLSFDEITEKFNLCSKEIIDDETAERIITLIKNIQHIGDINELSRLLIAEKSR